MSDRLWWQTAPDAVLRSYGLSQRLIDLSRQPLIRPGAVNMDMGYTLSILSAQDRVDLYSLAEMEPGEPVCWPPGYPMMGFVPYSR